MPEKVDLVALLRGRLGWTVEVGPRLEAAISARACEERMDVDAWLETIDDAKLTRLVDAAVVPHTSFGRHPEQLDALEARLVARRAKTPVRLWSAGCATGEEAWDLAMRAERAGVLADVVGTDVSAAAIGIAREGRYSARRSAGLPGAGPSGWRAPPALRERVRFAVGNVLDGRPDGPFDFVFCRNVALYFDRDDATALLERLATHLAPGGALVVAPAETLLPLPATLEHGDEAGWLGPRRAREKHPRARLPPVGPLERAARALGSGDPDEAEQTLRALLETRPDDARAWFLLGEALFERAEKAQARAAFERAAACAGSDAPLAQSARRRAG